MFPAAPINLFVGAARITSRSYKFICRGGCSTSRPYKQVFVKAVQSRTAPTVRFPAKKNSNLQFKFDQNCLFLRIPSSIRVAERPATNVPNRVRVAERHATNVPNATTSTIVLYKVQLQVQFVMIYIYNPSLNIQISYTLLSTS